jgi:hypothetical protein
MVRVSRIVRAVGFLFAALVASLSALPAHAAECWQGWGYLVEPRSMDFKSGQSLYVTEGPVNWGDRSWVRLYRVDPSSGRRRAGEKPIYIRPRQPIQKGSRNWAKIVEDVVEVQDSKLDMLLRLTHVKPSPNAQTLNDDFSRWACGLG